MKRERLSEEDQFAVVWGERQDELVAQIKLLIEQLHKQEQSEFEKTWEKTSRKKKETYVEFYSDWMMPKNTEMRFELNANKLCVYLNPAVFQEFNQIATKFIKDAIVSAAEKATFNNSSWICDGSIQPSMHYLSYTSAYIMMTTKEKFLTK